MPSPTILTHNLKEFLRVNVLKSPKNLKNLYQVRKLAKQYRLSALWTFCPMDYSASRWLSAYRTNGSIDFSPLELDLRNFRLFHALYFSYKDFPHL